MENQPWLQNKKWRNNRIRSNAKLQGIVLIVFTVIWWAFSSVLFFNFDEIRSKAEQEPMILMVLIFPIAGLWMLFLTFRAIRQWLKIGPTPLVLDPFPGSIGGHVGGYIDSSIPYSSNLVAKVSLHCIYSYISGSSEDRKRSETVKWQTDGICHNDHSAKGMQFRFRFDVPADLPETDVDSGNSYHLWRLNLETDKQGINLNRAYEIPVFKTAQESVGIRINTEEYQATIDAAVDGVESIAKLRPIDNGIEAWFPAFQRPGQGIMLSIFGLFFIGIGIGIGYADGSFIFPVVFSLVGGIFALAGIHYLAKALLISVTNAGIKVRRFLFGFPITTKTIAVDNFKKFEIEQVGTMQSNNKTTVYYRLYAHDKNGEKLPVGERLTSRSEVEVLKDSFERHIGS